MVTVIFEPSQIDLGQVFFFFFFFFFEYHILGESNHNHWCSGTTNMALGEDKFMKDVSMMGIQWGQ